MSDENDIVYLLREFHPDVDDYPGIDAAEEIVRLREEVDKLTQWKQQGMFLLGKWHEVWVALGQPGLPGDFLPEATLEEVKRLKAEVAG